MILTKPNQQQNQYQNTTFKEIILKGKKTGQTKYLIVLDDDNNDNDNYHEHHQQSGLHIPKLSSSPLSISFPNNHTVLSIEQTSSFKSVVRNKKKKSLGDGIARKSCSQLISLKQFPPIKPNTRSNKCLSILFYQQLNYAKIPNLLDHDTFEYKKLFFKKCISLRSREYFILP